MRMISCKKDEEEEAEEEEAEDMVCFSGGPKGYATEINVLGACEYSSVRIGGYKGEDSGAGR